MKDYKVLNFLDKIAFVYRGLGINYGSMRKILQVKLTMDERRVPTIMTNNKNTREGNFLKKSLISYGIIGLFIMFFMLMPLPVFVKMNFIFGMIIFMIMATMISDFSAVLLDIKEKNILLPRPIDSKTINAAKTTHIFIYLFTIGIVISGPSLIACLATYGFIAFLIFLIEMIFILCFVVFFTSILYFFVLMFFDGEKLKDMINYFQIILSIIMIIGYQFIGRIFNVVNLKITITPRWWQFILPSAWFSAPFSLILDKSTLNYYVFLSIASILIPIVLLLVYSQIIAPYFEKNLQKLSSSYEKKKSSIETKRNFKRKFIRIFTRSNTENTFFRFTQDMVSNERKLKLRLYPNLAFAACMPFIMLLSFLHGFKSLPQAIHQISLGKYYFFIYVAVLMLPFTFTMVSFSESYKGAWIYKVLPIEKTSDIFSGTFKGFMAKFIIPVYLFVCIIYMLIFGFKIIPDIILIFLHLILLMIIVFKISKMNYPFSSEFQTSSSGNSMTLLLLSVAYCGVAAAIQGILTMFTFGVTIFSIIMVVVIAFVWKKSFAA